jgi:hypothetical protein
MACKLVFVFLLLMMAGCSLRGGQAPPEDIDKAAALFFERLKSAEYDAIYNDVSKQFKQQVPKATILENLKQVSAMGRIQDYRRLSMSFEGESKDQMASPVYSVLFDRVAAEITVNFKDEDGEWRLLGFSVKQRGGGSARPG